MHYAVEVLADLREHSIRFLRLDFGYLAVAGAFVVALKFASESLYALASGQKGTFYFYFAIVAFDFYVAWLIHSDWLAAKSGYGRRAGAVLIRAVLYVQPAVHCIFLFGIASGLIAYSEGHTEAKQRIEGRVLMQEKVEAYLTRHGVVPSNSAELGTSGPEFAEIRRKLAGEDFRYEALGPRAYRLRFAGWDNVFDTHDDELVTEKYLIRNTWNRVFGTTK